VANGNIQNTVSVFAPDGTPRAPLTGLNFPRALAFDAAGNLFVANSQGGTVSVFAPGSTTPTATLTGLNNPSALALDAHATLFVANGLGNTVSVFAPDTTTPYATLTGLNGPSALAFDPHGDLLFVVNTLNGTVTRFTLAYDAQ